MYVSKKSSIIYKAVVLSSIVFKIIELIIMKQNRDIFKTTQYQFSYKQKYSKNMCTFVTREIAEHDLNSKSEVYMFLPEASKAFDRVEYVKLLKMLRTRGIFPFVTKMLLCMLNICHMVKKLDIAHLSM